MAIHNNETTNNGPKIDLSAAGIAASANATAEINVGNTVDNNADQSPIMGFGNKSFVTMASGLGSEYLTSLSTELKKLFQTETTAGGYKTTVTVLDKEIITNLAYSACVISLVKGNAVTYFTILIEATGRKPLTAVSVMESINSLQRTNSRSIDVFVTGDAVDVVLHKEIVKQLMAIHGDKYNFISVDGMVIPWFTDKLDDNVIRPIAATAHNACLIQSGKINNEFRDLNIATAKQETPSSYLKIDSNMLPTTTVDKVGRPIRADWQIDLKSIDSKPALSLNLQNNENIITHTTGFIDAIPEEIPTPPTPGMAQTTMVRLRPHVIISDSNMIKPTTGYALLSIVSSLVMVRPNMWLAAVLPNAANKLHDAGKLNMITNLENNTNGVGDALDLTDPKLNHQEVFAILKQMFSLNPVFSMDIDKYGPNTSSNSVFYAASLPGATAEEADAKQNAAQEIINSANWLTNGAFTTDFNPHEIFATGGIVIPTGRWIDKDGAQRDLREIDLSFIANIGNSTELTNKWALSNVPYSVSGMDPYVAKVDVISKLVPNAEIDGKAVRVTFSAKFINALSTACSQAGLETRYDPEVQFTETSNLSVLGSALGGAGIGQQNADFAHAFNGASSYQTPFSMGSYGRFQ